MAVNILEVKMQILRGVGINTFNIFQRLQVNHSKHSDKVHSVPDSSHQFTHVVTMLVWSQVWGWVWRCHAVSDALSSWSVATRSLHNPSASSAKPCWRVFQESIAFVDVTALALVSRLCERQEKHHGLRNCCKLCLEFALPTACSKAGTVHKESQWTWLTCVFPHHASAFASALKLQTRRRLCCHFRMPQVVTMYSEAFHAITSGRVRVQAAWVKSTLYIPVSYSQIMNLLECIGTHALFTCLHLWGHACLGLGHQEWRRSVSNAQQYELRKYFEFEGNSGKMEHQWKRMNRSLQPEAAGNAGSIPGGAAALGSMNLNLRLFQQRTVTTVVVSNKQTNRKLPSLVSGRASEGPAMWQFHQLQLRVLMCFICFMLWHGQCACIHSSWARIDAKLRAALVLRDT